VLAQRLQPLLDKVWAVAAAKAVMARTVTLKLKFSDFAQITRARSLTLPLTDRAMLEQVSLGLLRDAFPLRRSVRLIVTALSSLHPRSDDGGPRQLDFAM
jgi:DNA polymerase-4